MFKYRIVSFVLLLALFGVMIFWQPYGKYIFAAGSALLVFLLSLEVGSLSEKLGVRNYPKFTAVFCGLFFLVLGLIGCGVPRSYVLMGVAVYLPISAVSIGYLLLLFVRDKGAFFSRFTGSIGNGLMQSIPLFAYILVFYRRPTDLLFLVLVTKSMDTGGYVFGMLSSKLPGGNHKIVPSISPKKSWEGTIGGILSSILVAFLIGLYLPDSGGFNNILIIAPILAIGSFAGDLTESALKRACGVKDSGSVIPGMGGVFDVLDSFIYNGWIYLFLKELLG